MQAAIQSTGAALAILGGGNMGGAIAMGVRAAGLVPREAVLLVEPDRSKHAGLMQAASRIDEGLGGLGAWLAAHAGASVLLAVKPQMFPALARELRPVAGLPKHLVLSIMAGVSIATLTHELGTPRVVRAMPNLPATIRQGATAWTPSPGCTSADHAFAASIWHALGPVALRVDESQLDLVTAVGGSGPAYVFLLAEAMAASATQRGLARADAVALVRQTILGAAHLLASDSRDASELRAGVTSKGGTTYAAIGVLQSGGFEAMIDRAIAAGEARGRELGATR